MVLDHRRDDFAAWDRLQRGRGLRIAAADYELAIKFFAESLPNVTLIPLKSNADAIELLDAGNERFDAIAGPAEEMAAWNILDPRFRVVVPRPTVKKRAGAVLPFRGRGGIHFLENNLCKVDCPGCNFLRLPVRRGPHHVEGQHVVHRRALQTGRCHGEFDG